jgi:serine/threonine protein kinase
MGQVVHVDRQTFEPLGRGDPHEVGGYRLRARLGSGGMGHVYLSFSPGGRPVAVKVIRREIADNPEFRARFAHEVHAAQQVSGAYVAQLLDAGPDAPDPWLATAYVAGPTVVEAVRFNGPLTVAAVKTLIAGIAESLQAVHAAGIVHRDLKPANVVLGADGLRVIDFGIAHVADSTSLTPSGRLIGSPQYTAPEQVLGHSATSATDVFALGALAYFAATGQPAFGTGPDISVVYRIVNSDPDLDDCPEELRTLIMACLAKAAPDRPTTAELIEICQTPRIRSAAREWLPPIVLQVIEERSEAVAALAEQSTADDARRRAGGARHAAAPVDGHRLRRRALISFAGVLALVAAATGAALAISAGVAPNTDQGTTRDFADRTTSTGGTANSQPPSTAYGPDSQRPPPPPPPLPIQWYGAVRFAAAGINLDTVPPAAVTATPGPGTGSSGGNGTDVEESAPGPSSKLSTSDPSARNLARWTGAFAPNPRQCGDLIAAQGVWQLPAAVGDVICVRTDQGRIAVLTINTFPHDFSGVEANAIVWTPPPFPPPPGGGGPPASPPASPPPTR